MSRAVLNTSPSSLYFSLYTFSPPNAIAERKELPPGASFSFQELGLINLTVYRGSSDAEGATFCIYESAFISLVNGVIEVNNPVNPGICTEGSPGPDNLYSSLARFILIIIFFVFIVCSLKRRR